MNKTGIDRIVTVAVGIIAIGFIFVVGMKHIFPVIAPFIIAWFVAFAVREPAKRLSERLHLSERVLRPLLAILLTLISAGVLVLILWQITEAAWGALRDIASGENPIYDLLLRLTDKDMPLFGADIDPELAERISVALTETLSAIITRMASAVTGWAGSLPNALLFLVVTVIALVYFSIDLEKINTRVRRLLPAGVGNALSDMRREFFRIAGKFVISYVKLMLVTFTVTLIGFLILGVEGGFVLALIAALLDILPIVGVGALLLPWAIIEFALGEAGLAIGLILLFAVASVTRELLEPRIVGKSLNIHPLLMLLLIYVGYALFGIQGLLLIPLAAVSVGYLIKKNDTAEVGERADTE